MKSLFKFLVIFILFLIPDLSRAIIVSPDRFPVPDLSPIPTTEDCSGEDVDIVLMLDGSGSIDSDAADDIKEAAKGLLDIFIDDGETSSIAIGSFGSMATIDASLSTDYTNLQTVIDSLSLGSLGSTNVEEAITTSETELGTGSNTTKIIILLSDGVPTDKADATTAATNAKGSGIQIITIGFNLSSSSDSFARDFLATIATDVSADDQDADGNGEISETEQEVENNDGDYFYIAPDGDALEMVFESIAEAILNNWYIDSDGDGYGDASSTTTACEQPAGYVDNSSDCNDSDASVNPVATEICDGVDNDCDGDIDEGFLTTFYQDADSDGYGDPTNSDQACNSSASTVTNPVTDSSDCDDSSSSIYPSATEVCGDSVDQDCDGADTACPEETETITEEEPVTEEVDEEDPEVAEEPVVEEEEVQEEVVEEEVVEVEEEVEEEIVEDEGTDIESTGDSNLTGGGCGCDFGASKKLNSSQVTLMLLSAFPIMLMASIRRRIKNGHFF